MTGLQDCVYVLFMLHWSRICFLPVYRCGGDRVYCSGRFYPIDRSATVSLPPESWKAFLPVTCKAAPVQSHFLFGWHIITSVACLLECSLFIQTVFVILLKCKKIALEPAACYEAQKPSSVYIDLFAEATMTSYIISEKWLSFNCSKIRWMSILNWPSAVPFMLWYIRDHKNNIYKKGKVL